MCPRCWVMSRWLGGRQAHLTSDKTQTKTTLNHILFLKAVVGSSFRIKSFSATWEQNPRNPRPAARDAGAEVGVPLLTSAGAPIQHFLQTGPFLLSVWDRSCSILARYRHLKGAAKAPNMLTLHFILKTTRTEGQNPS